MQFSPSIISSFYIQNLAKDVAEPYTSLAAYHAGLIDEQGNYTGQESSVEPYDYFVIKLKKIIEQLPYGPTKASLSSYLTALKYFTEEISWYGVDKNQMALFLEGVVSANSGGAISLLEDMGTGGGAGAIGVPGNASGVNTGGVSGFDPVMGKMQKRTSNIPSFFDSCQMFDVCPEEYETFRAAREWRHVPEGPTRNYLQRYQRRNPQGKMAVRNNETGTIHWLNLKPKMISEQNGGVVGEYTDSITDVEDPTNNPNVATLTNSQEGQQKSKRRGKNKEGGEERPVFRPIEPSASELRDTIEIMGDEYRKHRAEDIARAQAREEKKAEKKTAELRAKNPEKEVEAAKPKVIDPTELPFGAESGERFGLLTRFTRDLPVLDAVLRNRNLGGRGQDFAAIWHGLARYQAQRPFATNQPFDIFGTNVDQGVVSLKPEDIKTLRATSERPFSGEEFEGVAGGFPKIDGRFAYETMSQAKSAGQTEEADRIAREVIDPYFKKPEVVARSGELLRQYGQERSQQYPDIGITLYPRPGQEPKLVTPADLQRLYGLGGRFRLASTGEGAYFDPRLQSKEMGRMLSRQPRIPVRPLTPQDTARGIHLVGGGNFQNLAAVLGWNK